MLWGTRDARPIEGERLTLHGITDTQRAVVSCRTLLVLSEGPGLRTATQCWDWPRGLSSIAEFTLHLRQPTDRMTCVRCVRRRIGCDDVHGLAAAVPCGAGGLCFAR